VLLKPSMNDVEEIESDETERILTCAAAVDVAKASGMVCVRRPHPSVEGRRTSRVWEVDSTTRSILALGDDLVALGVQRVVLESASDYWRPLFYLATRKVLGWRTPQRSTLTSLQPSLDAPSMR